MMSPWNASRMAALRMTRMRYNRRVKPFVDETAEPRDLFFDAIEGRATQDPATIPMMAGTADIH